MCLVSHFIDYIGYAKGGAEANVAGLCRHNTSPRFCFEIVTSVSPFAAPDFSGIHVPIRTAVGLYHVREASFLLKGVVSDLLYRLPGLVYRHNVKHLIVGGDVIHSHSLDILEVLRRCPVRVPVVLTIYNPLPRRYFSDLERLDCVIVRSHRVLSDMTREFQGPRPQLVYIPPGCEFAFYRSAENRHDEQDSLASREVIRLLLVGRLRPFKNVEGMIAAMQVLSRMTQPKYTLTIVGSGPRLGQLLRMAKRLGVSSRIRFLGNLPPQCMGSIYSSHDIVVVPSFYESFSQVSLEALVAGRRLLISEGMEEFRSKFPTIPTCNPRSPRDIAERIMHVAREPAPSISLNDLGAFDWQDVMRKHYEVYSALGAC